jgi:hypothetical protein
MTKTLKERFYVKATIVAAIVFVVLGYSILKLKNIVTGPDIVLYTPTDGASLKKELVTIKGRAERISQIYLNGRKIFTDAKGNFKESLLLASGYNVFEIKAEDQFGRQVVKKLELVYDQDKSLN